MIAPPNPNPGRRPELAGAAIALGAQNMHFGSAAPATSAPMLKAYGVTYMILGPSERRIFRQTS